MAITQPFGLQKPAVKSVHNFWLKQLPTFPARRIDLSAVFIVGVDGDCRCGHWIKTSEVFVTLDRLCAGSGKIGR